MPKQPLVLDTSANSIDEDDISSLPSPRIDNGQFEPFRGLPQAPLQRLPSSARSSAASSRVGSGIYTAPARSSAPTMDIVIPKRGEFVRQFSKIALNREKQQRLYTPSTPAPIPAIHSDRFLDKQDVYIAFTKSLHKTTWDRVKALGKGSFSRVILATPTLSQVRPSALIVARSLLVAVKITQLGDKDAKERPQIEEAIRRDIELVNRLNHPCLITVYAFNFDPQRALVVLPFIRGGDLFELVSHHLSVLSSRLVTRLVHDIVDALDYLHANNVVHRDVKLENVLIDLPLAELLDVDPKTYPHALAIVTDLGLARSIDPDNPMLTTRCGSEDYVPPEIILRQPYDGRQTDCWALGVLVYAMLEGRLPFDAPPRTNSGRVIKTSHRIARNDWAWYKVKEAPPAWHHLKLLVEGCLRKRDNGRLLSSDIVRLDWYKDAAPATLIPKTTMDPSDIFI